MADYRRFNKHDWDAFAGAECFNNGSAPFIYTRMMNNGLVDGLVELTIIADRTGIELYLTSEDDNSNVWDKNIMLTPIRAEGELKHLIEYLEKYDYAPDLAYELDHPSDPITERFEY